MNTRRFYLLLVALVITAFFVVACTPPNTPIPNQTKTVEIDRIIETNEIQGNIIQTKLFNQCSASGPLEAEIQFNRTTSESKQQELVLGGSIGGEAGLSVAAKVQIEASIEQHFASISTIEEDYRETIKLTIPAQSQQEYIITWRETRREGVIEYIEDGQTKTVNYSYRIGLEFVSSDTNGFICEPTPAQSTATPIPVTATATLAPIKSTAEGCISAQTWKIDSTDINLVSSAGIKADNCYDTGGLGVFANRSGVLQLFDDNNKVQTASGIYLPINSDSIVEFRVHVNYLYIVNTGTPAYINFAVAPANDPMNTRNTARFKLQVEDVANESLIYFVLADVGENTGAPLTNQHYEYGRTYTIRLEMVGSIMNVYINNIKQNESPTIPTGDKVFYIGYNLPALAGVDAEVTNIMVDNVPK